MTNLNDFEHIIKRFFVHPELLQEALTHRSFVNEADQKVRDNERLEFLGDAILDFVVAEMLFVKNPDVSEGELTQLRAALVRAESLARLAEDIRLGEFLTMGKGEETTGGRTRMNVLCDGFEAVLGAIYLDGGMEAAKAFVLPRLENLLVYIIENQLHKDARSILQERSQAELHYTPVYRVAEIIGKEHEREYLLEVVIGDVVIGEGIGVSKRNAAQIAARNALERLETSGWSNDVLEFVKTYNEMISPPDGGISDVPPSDNIA